MATPTPARAFIANHLAWYAKANNYEAPSFTLGLLAEEADGPALDGDVIVKWDRSDNCPELSCFGDAFHALAQMNDVLTELAVRGHEYNADLFVGVLFTLGFTDITAYANPDELPTQPDADLTEDRWKPKCAPGDVVRIFGEALSARRVVMARQYDEKNDRWMYRLSGNSGKLRRENKLVLLVSKRKCSECEGKVQHQITLDTAQGVLSYFNCTACKARLVSRNGADLELAA